MDVALVSCLSLPEPDPDAAPLSAALTEAGIAAEVLAWDAPGVDWSRARLTLLRSSWNYPRRPEAFLAWAEAAARVSELWNPLHVVRWNVHKSYLLELENRGVPIAPTVFLPRGSTATLADVSAARGWGEVVVKPAVSAASFRTMRVDARGMEAGEGHLRALVAERDVLIQQYLPSVEGYGERALIWIDGELTHAVRKSPRFLGEDEMVSERAVEISAAEADLARRVVDAVDGPILYGRVDVAPGPENHPVLMELELIEPSLFFPQCGRALDRFVAAVGRRLRK
jgi:glutathione synthase/RimK-type ligase-like ATP-grasp enzyme